MDDPWGTLTDIICAPGSAYSFAICFRVVAASTLNKLITKNSEFFQVLFYSVLTNPIEFIWIFI
jgi:molybdopterin biosynthesis enzyme